MAIDRDKLREYLGNDLHVDLSEVDDQSPLFTSGIVDSFAIVELMLTLNGDTVISEAVRQEAQGVTLQLTWANNHVHTIALRATDVDKLSRGEQVTKDSTEDNGHSHRVVLSRGSAMTYNIISMSNYEPHQLAVLTSPI